MKKAVFAVAFLVAVALVAFLTGCDRTQSPTDATTADQPIGLSKAGTGYNVPSKFNADGNLCEPGGTYNTQQIGTQMELWMGVGNETAGTLVGYVTFLSNPERVRIDLTDIDGAPGPDFFPYVVTTAHIHFGPTLDDIPHTNNGNPIPGQFEYNIPVDPYQSVIEVPVEFDTYGAIHLSVVKYGGIEGFNFYLPSNQVTLRITDYPSGGDPTYFKFKVTNGGFISDYDMGYGPGIYAGWCIDVDHTIGLNTNYAAYLYSSYETLPSWMVGPGKIENPDNLDKINYLVNHFSAGQSVQLMNADCTPLINPSTGLPYSEPLTYSDIQRAIWQYMDNNQSTSGLANWSQYRVNAILCDVNANGEGFVPDCNEKIVFLVVPTGTNTSFNVQIVIGQPIIGEVEVPCETMGGTAWGDGKFGANFPEAKQWGTYFLYGCL